MEITSRFTLKARLLDFYFFNAPKQFQNSHEQISLCVHKYEKKLVDLKMYHLSSIIELRGEIMS